VRWLLGAIPHIAPSKRQRSQAPATVCCVRAAQAFSHLIACMHIYSTYKRPIHALLFKHDLPPPEVDNLRPWFTLVPGARQYLFCSPRYHHYGAQQHQQPIKRFINLRKVSRTGAVDEEEHSPGGRRKAPPPECTLMRLWALQATKLIVIDIDSQKRLFPLLWPKKPPKSIKSKRHPKSLFFWRNADNIWFLLKVSSFLYNHIMSWKLK
jgi:hypothetical protein